MLVYVLWICMCVYGLFFFVYAFYCFCCLCDCLYSCDVFLSVLCGFFFFFKQKTAYEMRISDWSSDVCSSDLAPAPQDASQPDAAPAQPMVEPECDPYRASAALPGASANSGRSRTG